MYRNELDFLNVAEQADRNAPLAENAPGRVLGEIGLVLAVTLGIAAFLTVVFGS